MSVKELCQQCSEQNVRESSVSVPHLVRLPLQVHLSRVFARILQYNKTVSLSELGGNTAIGPVVENAGGIEWASSGEALTDSTRW